MRKFSAYGPSLIVLATALVVLVAGPRAVRELTYARTEAQIVRASARLSETHAILEQLNQAYRDIAEVVEPSVVHISATRRVDSEVGYTREQLSTGSGWIWDEHGHIVTNHHVVENAQRIDVQLSSGDLREAVMVGADELTDIAVLKIEPERLFPAQCVGRHYDVEQGDMVFAFGSPFDFRFSMSSGVVSGKGRSVGVIRGAYGGGIGYENFIQVDAAINPGNSGGPLTNHRGQVIGMNTAIATKREGAFDEGQFAGIGLAIPMDMIEPVVTQVIDNDGVVTKGYLGVEASNLSSQDKQQLRSLGFIGQGVEIRSLQQGMPAARSGLKRGDIITNIGQHEIRSMNQLRSVVSSTLPGQEIDVQVWRPDYEGGTGERLTIPVTLDRLNEIIVAGRLPNDQPTDRIEELGIARMSTASEQLASQYGVDFHRGVLLEQLVEDTSLQRGSIIIEVAGRTVTGTDEFIEALRDHNLVTGVPVTLIEPDGERVRRVIRAHRP